MEKVQTRISKKSGKGSQALASADARNATWPQVLAQVGTTAQQWSESRKTSNVSLFIDKIGRNSEAFQGWLQMLPNGDYGSRYVSLDFGAHADACYLLVILFGYV